MVRIPALLCVLACGCHGNDAQVYQDASIGDSGVDAVPPMFQPFWNSGTRMRARLFSPVEGGDPLFAGWRDTLLGINCENAIAADGVERCLPRKTRVQENFYADAACTQKLAFALTWPCGYDNYGVDSELGSELSSPPGPYHAFRLVAVHTGMLYGVTTEGCVMRAATTSETPGTWYVVNSSEEPAASFATTEHSNSQVGGFVHERYGFGDGSMIDLGSLAFPEHSCRPMGGSTAGMTRCRPSGVPTLRRVFSDAACTQRAFVWGLPYVRFDSPLPSLSEFVVDDDTSVLCENAFSVYENAALIARFHPLQVHSYYDEGCTRRDLALGDVLYSASPSSNYPTGTLSPSAPNGRLGYLMWTGPDGISIPIGSFDHQQGRECNGLVGSDGVLRCLPRQTPCDGVVGVDVVGEQTWQEPPTGPSCEPLGFSYDFDGWRVFDQHGTLIDPSTFAALSETIE